MTALAADRNVTRAGDQMVDSPQFLPVKANVKIYAGAIVVNDAGFAAPGRTAASLNVVGIARKQYDNTGGANSAFMVEFDEGSHFVANSTAGDLITTADIGNLCYLVDDQTVAKTSNSAARSAAGVIVNVDATASEVNYPVEVRFGVGLSR